MLAENDAGPALETLWPITEAEPDNDEALALTARALLHTDFDQAAMIAGRVGLGSSHYDEAEAVRTLASMFARVDDPGPLPDNPVKEDYLQALRSARSGNFKAALDGLIDVVRKDRRYDDDGARRCCVAIFYLLGNDHELTRRSRAVLSSALY